MSPRDIVARDAIWSAAGHPTATRHRTLIENVEDLLEFGESLPHVTRRVGYGNPDALSRQLYRIGRPDLARRFQTRYRATS